MTRGTSLFQGARPILPLPTSSRPTTLPQHGSPPSTPHLERQLSPLQVQAVSGAPLLGSPFHTPQTQPQGPRPPFPPRRPFRHQVRAQAREKAEAARALQQRLHNFHSAAPAPTPTTPSHHNRRTPRQPSPRSQPRDIVQQPQRNSIASLLDSAFRLSADRIQTELTNLRAMCARAMRGDEREKELLRSYTLEFKRDTDMARETAKALVATAEAAGELESGSQSGSEWANESRGVKRGREEAESDISPASTQNIRTTPSMSTYTPPFTRIIDQDPNAPSTSYPSPSSSTSPRPPLPLPSSPIPQRNHSLRRNKSADPILAHPSNDMTTPYPTTIRERSVGPDDIERRSKRRRTSDSSESSGTLIEEAETWFDSEFGADRSVDRGSVDDSEDEIGDILASPSDAILPPSSSPKRASPPIDLTHVDLMYEPIDDRLICRACIIGSDFARSMASATTPPPSPKSFPTNASWDTLKEHCTEEHPNECKDLAGLDPRQIYELRRGFMLKS